jgi:hypothetical protein
LRAKALFVSLSAVIVVVGIVAVPCVNAGAAIGKRPAVISWKFLFYLDSEKGVHCH